MVRDTLIAVRAHDRADRTRAAFAATPFQIHVEEVLSYRPSLTEASSFPDLVPDAVIATSARAFEFLPPGFPTPYDCPVYVVGEATAEAAWGAGFTDVRPVGSTAAEMIAFFHMRTPMSLLYLRGDQVAVDCKEELESFGFQVVSLVVYTTREAGSLSPVCLDLLQENRVAGILFFSRETARHFCALVERCNIIETIKPIQALCFSLAVLKSVDHLPWTLTTVAARPHLAALVALVAQGMGVEGRVSGETRCKRDVG